MAAVTTWDRADSHGLWWARQDSNLRPPRCKRGATLASPLCVKPPRGAANESLMFWGSCQEGAPPSSRSRGHSRLRRGRD